MAKIKYVKENDAVKRGEGTQYMISNFITKDDCNKVSLAVSKLDGEAPETENSISDRIYYFLEGEAVFIFKDRKISIEKGSALFIPHETRYKMNGKFTAVLINSPAFNFENEQHFE